MISNTLLLLLVCLAGLIVTHAHMIAVKRHQSPPQQPSPLLPSHNRQIVNLPPVQLIEEFNYTNKVLFDFNQVSDQLSKNRYKLRILSVSTTLRNRPSTVDSSSNLLSKFAVSDSLVLYTNDRFDREELIATNQCERPTESLLAMHTNDTRAYLHSTGGGHDSDEEISDCMFKIKLAAYDAHNSLVNIYILPVLVNDVNDHMPVFRSRQMTVGVSENLQRKTVVPLEAPLDPDSDKYSIQNCLLLTNINNLKYKDVFDVVYSRHTHNLNLVVNAPLDYETKKEYTLELSCFDGAGEALANIVVNVLDANDHVPYFRTDAYNISVAEGVLATDLLQIEAVDLDDPNGPNGQLTYTLPCELNTGEACNEYFMIDNSTGMLGLRKPLDYEKTKLFALRVKVQDRGATNSVPVYIDVHVSVEDVNDNAPQGVVSFEDAYIVNENRLNNTIWISEDVYGSGGDDKSIGLGFISLTDIDSPPVNGYSLAAELTEITFMNTVSLEMDRESTDVTPTFKLYPVTTDYNNVFYLLQLNSAVDREKALYYDLKIRLYDNVNEASRQQIDHVLIRVILLDVNDNRPHFLNTTKGHATVFDNNITTINTTEFAYYKFYVSENQLKLNFAHIKAVDADFNPTLEYTLLAENNKSLLVDYMRLFGVNSSEAVARRNYLNSNLNPNYLFYVNGENGSLSLRGELDREQRDFYLFTVRVYDTPATYSDILVEVNIMDENDNQPNYFTPAVQFSVKENESVDTVVGSVRAHDPDANPRIEYTIEPAIMRQLFHVDQTTGSLLTSRVLDAEDPAFRNSSTFNFRVHARDTEFTLTKTNFDQSSILNVSVQLTDVNDNAPSVIEPLLPADRLVLADLATLNNTLLRSIRTIDEDRDCAARGRHMFNIVFTRRFSWQFLNEIIQNNESFEPETIEFIKSLVEVAKQPEFSSKIDIKSLFSLTRNGEEEKTSTNRVSCTDSAQLSVKSRMDELPWGVYNLSVRVEDGELATDFAIKVLVFNTTGLNVTRTRIAANNTTLVTSIPVPSASQMVLLGQFLENWWAQNVNLITTFNNKQAKQSNDANAATAEDIDNFAHDYYKFYASAFSRFNSFNDKNGVGSNFNLTGGIGQLFDYLVFKNTSNSVIGLIGVFVVAAAFLVSIVIYKHRRAAASLAKKSSVVGSSSSSSGGGGGSSSSKKMFVNLNNLTLSGSNNNSSAGSSFNISDHSTTDLSASEKKFTEEDRIDGAVAVHQSTRELTSSPNMAAKFGTQMSSTRYTNSASTNTTTAASAIQVKRSSICEPFTVVTTLPDQQQQQQQHQKQYIRNGQIVLLPPSSISSVVSESSDSANSITPPLPQQVQQTQGGSTFLSTFSPMSGGSTLVQQAKQPSASSSSSVHSSAHQDEEKSSNPTTPPVAKTADLGYYGSSDYSENHNSSFGVVSNKDYQMKQLKLQQQQQQQQQQSSNVPHTSVKIVNIKPQGTNSSTSFTSSLLSSPSTSTDSTSSITPPYTTVTKTPSSLNQNHLNYQQQQQHHHHHHHLQQYPATVITTTTNPPPAITTLYHPNIYTHTHSGNPAAAVQASKIKNSDVKIYFERFERIYNSESMNEAAGLIATPPPASTNSLVKNLSNPNECNSVAKRNTTTTYSYV